MKGLSGSIPVRASALVLGALGVVAAIGNVVVGAAFGRGGALFAWTDGARETLLAALGVFVFTLIAGTAAGAVAALGPPIADTLLSRAMEIAACLPSVIAVFVVRALAPIPELAAIAVVLAVLRGLQTAKVARARILTLASEDFVLAARALGSGRTRLFRAHLLPHLAGPAIASASLAAAAVVGLDAALSFMGLGGGGSSWGASLAAAFEHPALLPGLGPLAGVLATVVSLLVLAEAFGSRWSVGRRFV